MVRLRVGVGRKVGDELDLAIRVAGRKRVDHGRDIPEHQRRAGDRIAAREFLLRVVRRVDRHVVVHQAFAVQLLQVSEVIRDLRAGSYTQLATLQTSNIIIPDETLRKKFQAVLDMVDANAATALGMRCV